MSGVNLTDATAPYLMCSGAACFARVFVEGAKCVDCFAFETRVAAYAGDEIAQRHGVAFARDGFPQEMRGGHSHFCPGCNQHVPCEEHCSIEPDLNDVVGIYYATSTLCDDCRPKNREDEPDYEVRMLRATLKAIGDLLAAEKEGAPGRPSFLGPIALTAVETFVDTALCPHKWEGVTVSGPAEPKEADVVCSVCGVNQYEFLKAIGLEE